MRNERAAKPKQRKKKAAAAQTDTTQTAAPSDARAEAPAADTRWLDGDGRDGRDYPGIIRFRHTRATGALVITIRVAEYGRDDLKPEDGKYAALCISHGGINRTQVRRAANYSLPDSHERCGGCAADLATAN